MLERQLPCSVGRSEEDLARSTQGGGVVHCHLHVVPRCLVNVFVQYSAQTIALVALSHSYKNPEPIEARRPALLPW